MFVKLFWGNFFGNVPGPNDNEPFFGSLRGLKTVAVGLVGILSWDVIVCDDIPFYFYFKNLIYFNAFYTSIRFYT